MAKLHWYGYRHVNGTFHAKRHLGDMGDYEEAHDSDFVESITAIFVASGRDEAVKKIKEIYKSGHRCKNHPKVQLSKRCISD